MAAPALPLHFAVGKAPFGRGIKKISVGAIVSRAFSATRDVSRSQSPVSQRLLVGFAGADADDLLDGVDEDFSVADFAGAGGLDDGVDGLFGFI